MATVITWSVLDMKRDVATGGVKEVRWQCHASDDAHPDCAAVEAGKYRCTPDASADGFIAYDDLTEEVVLDWVFDSFATDDETADEAKAAIELVRRTKVEAQIARKVAEAHGTPWAVEPEAAD